MFQDYLDAKEQTIGIKKRQEIAPKITISKTNININKLLDEKKKQNKELLKQFQILNEISSGVSKSVKGITTTVKMISLAVLAGAGALLGIVTYLNSLSGEYSSSDFKGSGMSTGKTSEQGIHDLLQYESFKPYAYQDQGGVWTIGYGHTGKVDGKPIRPGMTITQEKAMELFKSDLKAREDIVNRRVKVPITQNMFDVLVSLVYNAGEGGCKTVFEKLNQGDYKGAAEAMKRINKVKDPKTGEYVVSQGLVNRRQKEYDKWMIDVTPDNKLVNPYNTISNKNKTAGTAKVSNFVNAAKSNTKHDFNKAKSLGLTGNCAARVHDYLEAAGIQLPRKGSAYMYADVLAAHPNFMEVDPSYPKEGDVIVFGPTKEAIHGHIFISDGTTENYKGRRVPNSGWSDFKGRQCNLDSYSGVRAFRYIEQGKQQTQKPTSPSTPKSNVNQGNQNKPKEIPKPESKPQETPPKQETQTPQNQTVPAPVQQPQTQPKTVNTNDPPRNKSSKKK